MPLPRGPSPTGPSSTCRTSSTHLPETIAAALSVFWAFIVGGRLLVSILALRLPTEPIWIGLPGFMIAAFLFLPYADTPVLGIALFAFAGLACSAFFPLTIGLASRRFERHVPWVSSALIAALMVGVGMGSYVIGLLREALPLERLYQLSALYPAAVLALGWSVFRSNAQAKRRAQPAPHPQPAPPGALAVSQPEQGSP